MFRAGVRRCKRHPISAGQHARLFDPAVGHNRSGYAGCVNAGKNACLINAVNQYATKLLDAAYPSLIAECDVYLTTLPWADGYSIDIIKAGEQSELASAMHAEQVLIARAAEEGISLRGTDIYLTTFPCPLCAKLIAFSGIRRCFIKGGHASLDGEHVLRARRVEIILVK